MRYCARAGHTHRSDSHTRWLWVMRFDTAVCSMQNHALQECLTALTRSRHTACDVAIDVAWLVCSIHLEEARAS
jgi:hypothetical protein